MPDAYKKTSVGIDETPGMLSARTGIPICMLLRANRLVCPAWLLPGREIIVPEGDFCKKDAFPCPKRLANSPAREKETEVCISENGDTLASLASAMGTSERLLILSRELSGPLCEGERILIESALCKKRIGSVLPGETLEAACRRLGAPNRQEVMRLNRLEGGNVWPGMRLILPDDSRVL